MMSVCTSMLYYEDTPLSPTTKRVAALFGPQHIDLQEGNLLTFLMPPPTPLPFPDKTRRRHKGNKEAATPRSKERAMST